MTFTGTIIRLNPGQDWSADATMPDGAGGAADLTGFTASIADASDELPGAVAVSIPDAANGLTRRTITWQAGWALTPRVLGQFRERYVNGAQDNATNLVTVMVDGTETSLVMFAGADYDAEFVFAGDDGGPADLTGQTVEPYGVTDDLVGLVTVTVLDAATGRCGLHIEGNPALSAGIAGTFQIIRYDSGPTNRRTLNVHRVTIR